MSSFRLVYGDADLSVGLPLESHVEEQLLQLLDTSDSRASTASRIADIITAMLSSEAPLPTDSQVKYAVAIARTLNLQLPADVLQSRSAMGDFLEQHAQTYRRTKGDRQLKRSNERHGSS